MKFSKEGGEGGGRGFVHRDTNKEGNGGKIKVIGTSHYFIVRQVALLGVSDHCVKNTKCIPCPHEYIYEIPMD